MVVVNYPPSPFEPVPREGGRARPRLRQARRATCESELDGIQFRVTHPAARELCGRRRVIRSRAALPFEHPTRRRRVLRRARALFCRAARARKFLFMGRRRPRLRYHSFAATRRRPQSGVQRHVQPRQSRHTAPHLLRRAPRGTPPCSHSRFSVRSDGDVPIRFSVRRRVRDLLQIWQSRVYGGRRGGRNRGPAGKGTGYAFPVDGV